jgi:hypothetical protein
MKSAMISRWMIWARRKQCPTYSGMGLWVRVLSSVFSYEYVKIQKIMERTREMAWAATKCDV